MKDREIIESKPDFGSTPTLFLKDQARRGKVEREADDTAVQGDRTGVQ